ncbi:MAG: hypothetical protein M1379_14435 [Firmicutes bacterium]|nr:hypothetical protein [Bacillota bacterium]
MSDTPLPLGSLRFPENSHLAKLARKTHELGIRFAPSDVHELWFYQPADRTIYVWEPDLRNEPIAYLVVILAHELGHVIDFAQHPSHREMTRHLHWSQVPAEVEFSAFITGYCLLQELEIPLSVEDYTFFIDPRMAGQVRAALAAREACRQMAAYQEVDESRPV